MKVFEIEVTDKVTGEVDRWSVRSCRAAQEIARREAKNSGKRVLLRMRRELPERQQVWLFRVSSRELVCLDSNVKRKVALQSMQAFDSRGGDAIMILWPEWAEDLRKVLAITGQ